VVHRAARGAPAREIATTLATGDTGDRVASGIGPLFGPPAAEPAAPRGTGAPTPPAAATPADPAPAPAPAPAAAGDAAPPAASPGSAAERTDRTIGIALISGGGVGLVLGVALWASYSSLQSSIDAHPVRTFADIQDLKSIEDRASSRAVAGDVFVVAGLIAGGIGAYYLYRDHTRHTVAVAPVPLAHGGGLTITVIGGPW
jgi:hypothetical protein